MRGEKMSEEKYHGMSPLAIEEKEAIIRNEYAPRVHRAGLGLSLVQAGIIFLPALYLLVAFRLWPGWATIGKTFASVAAFAGPYWFIEPVSYFLILGIAGTYVSFLAGNISNMRLPVSAVAQEVAGVREGSPEGEIIGAIGIVASQWALTIATISAAIIVTLVIEVLPKTVTGAFDFLLPCLWGAIFGQFTLRAPQYAVVAMIIGIPLVIWSGLPPWTLIPIMVFGLAILSIILFKKGIWVPKKG
jgi:hypothetical protein